MRTPLTWSLQICVSNLLNFHSFAANQSWKECRLPDLLVLWKISDKRQGHAIAFHHLSLKGFKVCYSAKSVEKNQTPASVIKLLSYKLASVPWRSAGRAVGISTWFSHLDWITGPPQKKQRRSSFCNSSDAKRSASPKALVASSTKLRSWQSQQIRVWYILRCALPPTGPPITLSPPAVEYLCWPLKPSTWTSNCA